jgi:predicted glycosyltransferase
MPAGLQWAQPVVRFFNMRYVRRFTRCWVPDVPGQELSGVLSNTSLSVTYVGWLSRFTEKNISSAGDAVQYKLVVILSGPEPQRTALEDIIKPQLIASGTPCLLVRGVVEPVIQWLEDKQYKEVNFLTAKELLPVIRQAELIIARSGYSTLLDLAVLGKKAVFVPTPGQTEQEYLAERLLQHGMCYSVAQQNFKLTDAMEKAKGFTGFSNIELSGELLSQALEEALSL